MEHIKAEIPGTKQSSKENQTLSFQPTCINEMGTRGKTSIEMSDAPNSAFSVKNYAQDIGTSNMAGQVYDGMNNDNSTNINLHLHPTVDFPEGMACPNKDGSANRNTVAFGRFYSNPVCEVDVSERLKGFKYLRIRRTSETEISLGSRTEVVNRTSTVTEDTDTNSQIGAIARTVQPNGNKVQENKTLISNDDVDGNERRLAEGLKLEVGTAVPETHPQVETNCSPVTCSTSEVLIGALASAGCIPLLPETDSNYDNGSADVDALSQEAGSYNVVTSISPGKVVDVDVDRTMVQTPSVEMKPRSKSSKKGPGNTEAEEPNECIPPANSYPEGRGSLTRFSSLCDALANMNPNKRLNVEIIFKQVVYFGENLPTSEMKKISDYLFTCMDYATMNPVEDLDEPAHGNFISLTDFKELEKKLRKLDDYILSVDFPVIMNIARFRPQMLPKIMRHLNSFREVAADTSTVATSTVASTTVSPAPGPTDGDDEWEFV